MSHATSIGLHYLRKAELQLNDAANDNKQTPGGKLLAHYVKRIQWVLNDVINSPVFISVRPELKAMLEEDLEEMDEVEFRTSAVAPEQRAVVLDILTKMEQGKKFEVVEI